jgi:hypothetical protein
VAVKICRKSGSQTYTRGLSFLWSLWQILWGRLREAICWTFQFWDLTVCSTRLHSSYTVSKKQIKAIFQSWLGTTTWRSTRQCFSTQPLPRAGNTFKFSTVDRWNYTGIHSFSRCGNGTCRPACGVLEKFTFPATHFFKEARRNLISIDGW